jgi:hypothetical protein
MAKGLNIKVNAEDIMYTNISKSKDGYNSARVVIKYADKEYMTVSYEWEGEGVPGFALELMGTMKAAEINNNEVVEKYKEEFSAIHNRNPEGL